MKTRPISVAVKPNEIGARLMMVVNIYCARLLRGEKIYENPIAEREISDFSVPRATGWQLDSFPAARNAFDQKFISALI